MGRFSPWPVTKPAPITMPASGQKTDFSKRNSPDTWREFIPFGLASHKPRHFRDMLKVAWENRDNLGYAWKVLSKGVCDGCALGVSGFHDWTIDGVHLCMTRLNLLRLNTMPELDHSLLEDVGQLSGRDNRSLRSLGRLAYPMVRRKGDRGFKRISWDQALQGISRHIRDSKPDRLAFFLTSRGITNEVYYVAQKVARFLGTNHVDNAARLCHSPSTVAMKRTLGVAASTCSYVDWLESDLIVFFGSNPANDQPVSTKYLLEAKARGVKVVLVNPYMEPGMDRYWVPSNMTSAVFGSRLTDYWFPVTQGGDIAFCLGVTKSLIEKKAWDSTFVEDHVDGFSDIQDAVRACDWAELESESGVDKASMEAFADLLAGTKKVVFVWSMGITQHARGVDAVQSLLNLGLIMGYIGRDGAGLMPIRGHSSVQGGAEMGAYATAYPGGKPIEPENARWLSELYGFDVPTQPGLSSVEMVWAAAQGKLDLLYCLGGNFLRTLPDPDSVSNAMQNVPCRVHQDILLTDQMWIEPGEEVYLLPARTRYEQEDGGIETTTERRILFSPEIPRQVGEARSEWRILLDLAREVDPERAERLGCATGQKIREEIARVVPIYKGVERFTKAGDAVQYGGRHLCVDGQCQTENGKAKLFPVALDKGNETGSGPTFRLTTRRGKQFNTLVYAEIDPFNQAPRNAVLINEIDAYKLGFRQGDEVKLKNGHGEFQGRIHLVALAEGNIQVHWPEGNVLLPSREVEPQSKVPNYATTVTMEKPQG